MSELELSKKLNQSVLSVISADKLMGFERAFLIAKAAQELQQSLTSEYMKPIMALQGNRLGFKTDRDSEAIAYPEAVVKHCLIEAVLTGVEPFGNQFNIIAGNCYITKEGFGHLLANMKGLDYEIIPGLPRINAEKTGAAIVMKITWTYNGKTESRDLDLAIRMNARMGVDAVIGKATRKARKWLHDRLTGIEIADGDVTDIPHTEVKSTTKTQVEKEQERIVALINSASTKKELGDLFNELEEHLTPELFDMFDKRKSELK